MNHAQTRTIVLSRAQAKVLADIKLLQDKTGHTQLSVRQLAGLTGVPRSTVSYAISRLNDMRVLFTYRGTSGKPTVHRILYQGALRSVRVQKAAAAAGGRS